ncbi:MAG: DUF4956 domain-containing protein [Reichenbachiella sp.]
MFDNLTEGNYYEFPSFEVALYSILLAFVLSSAISFTYHLTSQGSLSRNFIQAMVLSSIVTCMVIMAVGNNVAAGFGIMGAIAIIRFRLKVENPRNIIFIFAALSVGVGAGVYGYSIAVAGTIVFCVMSLILHVSPYGSKVLDKEFNLELLLLEEHAASLVEQYLENHCRDFRLMMIADRTRGTKYEYFITLKADVDKESFYASLKEQAAFINVSLERSDNLGQL